jgi:hypothetical protein
LLKDFLFFLMLVTAASTAVYLLAWVTRWRRVRRGEPGLAETLPTFTILTRADETVALRADQPFRGLMGLLYAAGFFWAIPVFLWRYGIGWTVALIAVPIATSPIVVAATFWVFGISSPDNVPRFLAGAAVMAVLRGAGGVIVGKCDARIALAHRTRKGWVAVATLRAPSSSKAIQAVRPIGTASSFSSGLRAMFAIFKRRKSA